MHFSLRVRNLQHCFVFVILLLLFLRIATNESKLRRDNAKLS